MIPKLQDKDLDKVVETDIDIWIETKEREPVQEELFEDEI